VFLCLPEGAIPPASWIAEADAKIKKASAAIKKAKKFMAVMAEKKKDIQSKFSFLRV